MKPALALASLFLLSGAAACRAPYIQTQNASLLAGQRLDISNSESVRIHIQSEYPVSVLGAGCSSNREADVTLDCGPSIITVTDLRPRFFFTARANRVVFTTSYSGT
jgi:hypothetical protein